MFTQRLESPWNFSQGFLILITFVAVYFALNTGHMIWVKSTVGFKQYLQTDTDFYTKVMIMSQLSKAAAIFLAIWFVALKRHRLNWQTIGFVCTSRKWLLLAIVLAVAGFMLRVLLMRWMAVEVPGWVKFMQPPIAKLDLSFWTLAGFLIITVLITPFAEEIFFRGFLFRWMAHRRPIWIAAIVSSLMFGASHIVPPQAIAAALLSLIIIYLFVKSGSIWPAIVCHIVNNALSIGGNLLASANKLPDFLMPPAV